MTKLIEAEIYGNPYQVARNAADRGIAAAFVREAWHDDKRVSVVRCGEQFREPLRQWAMERGIHAMRDIDATAAATETACGHFTRP